MPTIAEHLPDDEHSLCVRCYTMLRGSPSIEPAADDAPITTWRCCSCGALTIAETRITGPARDLGLTCYEWRNP